MLYLLSWRGWGALAFFGIFVTVGFMAMGSLINEDGERFGFAVGWLAVGAACLLIGKRVNRDEATHLFCNLKLQTWGVIYGCIGLFLGLGAIRDRGAGSELKKPLRPATRPISMIDAHYL